MKSANCQIRSGGTSKRERDGNQKAICSKQNIQKENGKNKEMQKAVKRNLIKRKTDSRSVGQAESAFFKMK